MSEQKPPQDPSDEAMTNRQAYNVLSDTIAGPNLRLRDNLYQGLAILVCLLVGAGIGFLVITDGLAGALVGGFVGMVIGLFGSGIFLMIFRAIKHVRGHHD
jgi:ABC-type microcin C transport system permease subunit YejE